MEEHLPVDCVGRYVKLKLKLTAVYQTLNVRQIIHFSTK